MLPRPSLELARSTVFGCVELVGCIVAHSSIEMVAHALKRINQGFLEASRARLVELQAWRWSDRFQQLLFGSSGR